MRCIFLIDDNEIDLWLAQKVIQNAGIAVSIHTARSGEEALVMLDDYYETKQQLPQIIMVNLNLPVVNGFEVIQKIRSLSFFDKNKTTLVLMAAGIDNEIDKPLIKAMDIPYVLLKPLTHDMLTALVK